MNHYFIGTPQKEQQCRNLIDLVNAVGYLHSFDWGCMGGVQ